MPTCLWRTQYLEEEDQGRVWSSRRRWKCAENERLAALELEVGDLREKLAGLQQAFEEFKGGLNGSRHRRLCCRYLRGETPVLLKTRLKCCTIAKPMSRAMRAISISVVSLMAVLRRRVCKAGGMTAPWPLDTRWIGRRLSPMASATSRRELTWVACCWI